MSKVVHDLTTLTPEQRIALEQRLQQKRSLRSAQPTIPRRADTSWAVLSFAQQRLWFLAQLEPDSPFYNIPVALQVRGTLHVEAVRQSLEELVRCHEALRTRFVSVDGQPVQQIVEPFAIALPIEDVSDQPYPEREAAAYRAAEAACRQPFDLERVPLLRPLLIRLAPTEHLLVLAMHHIISDGWSTGILIRELTKLYTAFSSGQTAVLPDLRIQYADFAIWQRQWMQEQVLAEHLAYWKHQLRDIPALLELPTDHPRPAVQTFTGRTYVFHVEQTLTQQINLLSQQEGCTLFMTLLATFNVLLHQYSQQTDIVVGTPIANRTLSDIEHVIGFFVNTLMFRNDLAGNPTFRELLQRVREVTLGAYAHQHLPFEKLVEELSPERNLSYTPLFQVMFAVQNAPTSALEASGLEIQPLEMNTGAALFDLMLSITEADGKLVGRLEYSTDLFESTSIVHMADRWVSLLRHIVADPDQRLDAYVVLTAAERALLAAWNKTGSIFEPACVHQLVERAAKRTPEATALIFGDIQLTYRELDRRANQLAHYLQERGVGPDVLVGISMERSLEAVIAVLGVLKAGGAYVPLDLAYPRDRLAFMLEDAQVWVLLTKAANHSSEDRGWWVEDADVRADDPSSFMSDPLYTVVDLVADWPLIAHQPDTAPHSAVMVDHLAYVIYTSGSTGRPKGISMSHRVLGNLLRWHSQHPNLGRAARTLQFSSLSFDVSFQEIFSTWCAGAALVLISEEDRRDAERLWATLHDKAVERLFIPFVALQHLSTVAWQGPLPDLRDIITAGEQLQITPAIRLLFEALPNVALHNHYGPSESHAVTAFTLSGAPAGWPLLPPIGRPIANTDLHILDHQLRPVPIGVPGELYIGGMSLARGYHRRPDLTAERFIPNPFTSQRLADEPQAAALGWPGAGRRPSGARLYKTGDLVRYLPDGNIAFLGRRDDQVKVRGFRIELGEIESALLEHPLVQTAVVVVKAYELNDRRLVAYLVTHPQPAPSAQELRSFLRQKLPDHMVPAAFIVLESLPRTQSGKVDRRALPDPDQQSLALAETFVAPRTPTEETLAAIWGEVLGITRVGVEDNFFKLGGHSLLATQVVARIRTLLQAELPLRSLFEAPTLGDLATAIERCQKQGETNAPAVTKHLRRVDARTLIDQFDQLSSAEVDTLLAQLLTEEG
jgi:surfactin family lipopeptide synthetase A